MKSYPFPKQHILGSSKLEEFADDNFEFDENGRKFSKQVENTEGKSKIDHSQMTNFRLFQTERNCRRHFQS